MAPHAITVPTSQDAIGANPGRDRQGMSPARSGPPKDMQVPPQTWRTLSSVLRRHSCRRSSCLSFPPPETSPRKSACRSCGTNHLRILDRADTARKRAAKSNPGAVSGLELSWGAPWAQRERSGPQPECVFDRADTTARSKRGRDLSLPLAALFEIRSEPGCPLGPKEAVHAICMHFGDPSRAMGSS